MAPKKHLRVPDSAPLGFLRLKTASERLAAGDAAGAAEVAQGILRSARSRTPVFRLILQRSLWDPADDDDDDVYGRTRGQGVKECRIRNVGRVQQSQCRGLMMMVMMMMLMMMIIMMMMMMMASW